MGNVIKLVARTGVLGKEKREYPRQETVLDTLFCNFGMASKRSWKSA